MLTSLVSPGALATRLTMERSQGKKRNIAAMTKQGTRNLQPPQMEGKCCAFGCVLGSDILSSRLYFGCFGIPICGFIGRSS